MDPLLVASASEELPPAVLRPLTRKKRDGKLYERDSQVARQIAASLVLTQEELIQHAHLRDQDAEGYLQEEVLVYLIRESQLNGNDAVLNGLCEELLRRIQPYVEGKFRSLAQDEARQAEADVQMALFELILDVQSDRGDFLQVRFWCVLKRLTITAFREVTRYLNKQWTPRDGEDAEDEPDPVVQRIALSAGKQPRRSLDEWAQATEALQRMPEPYRTAFILHYGEGWQIESHDPSEPTISRQFGKTPRTIRNWLSKAERALEEWRGNGHD